MRAIPKQLKKYQGFGRWISAMYQAVLRPRSTKAIANERRHRAKVKTAARKRRQTTRAMKQRTRGRK